MKVADEFEPKTCFVIAPIGAEGSGVRRGSDLLLKHVIRPIASSMGYVALRADEIADPGLITSHVIQHLINDDLVIADLSGHNPNVFYELAIRHAVGKPVIQMMYAGEALPFDVANSRTISFDIKDLDSVEGCKVKLADQIRALETGGGELENPVSIAINLGQLASSDNALETSNAEILNQLAELRASLRLLAEGHSDWLQQGQRVTRVEIPRRAPMQIIVDCDDFEKGKFLHLVGDFRTVSHLLDAAYSAGMDKYVEIFSYGKEWYMVNEDTGSRIEKVGETDKRPLGRIGVLAGARLRATRLRSDRAASVVGK